jgi:hypothetical protein
MFTKIMKWVSIAALLLAVLWRPTASYQVLLEILVCVSALLVVTQAVGAGKYFWVVGFVAIAVLFNPVVPLALSRKAFLWLGSVSLLTFLVSLVVLKRHPILSVPSITNRTPGSESL